MGTGRNRHPLPIQGKERQKRITNSEPHHLSYQIVCDESRCHTIAVPDIVRPQVLVEHLYDTQRVSRLTKPRQHRHRFSLDVCYLSRTRETSFRPECRRNLHASRAGNVTMKTYGVCVVSTLFWTSVYAFSIYGRISRGNTGRSTHSFFLCLLRCLP